MALVMDMEDHPVDIIMDTTMARIFIQALDMEDIIMVTAVTVAEIAGGVVEIQGGIMEIQVGVMEMQDIFVPTLLMDNHHTTILMRT